MVIDEQALSEQAPHMQTSRVCEALFMAEESRQSASGLLVHTVLGSLYASEVHLALASRARWACGACGSDELVHILGQRTLHESDSPQLLKAPLRRGINTVMQPWRG